MCGVFFTLDLKKGIRKKEKTKYKVNFLKYLDRRGPDSFKEVSWLNSYSIHSRLSITGEKDQPLNDSEKILLYNGEIYNDWKKYKKDYGDLDFLNKFIKKNNFSNFKKLDGEYAIILLEKKKKTLHLITDTFGTKPLYYAILKNKLYVASYDQTLFDLNIKRNKVKGVRANTHIKINFRKKLKETKKFPLKRFNFKPVKKTTYKDFEKNFVQSIKKRSQNVQKKISVPLSSGIDSGLIAAVLNKFKINFTSYIFEKGEILKILKIRKKILKENKKNIVVNIKFNSSENLKVRKFLMRQAPFYNWNIDYKPYSHDDYRFNTGITALGKICDLSRKNKNLILLSGHGGDEIISDYYNVTSNSRRSCLKGNWKLATKPWKNFYDGLNAAHLAAIERVAGAYGIETRYPFLDFDLIQSFLALPTHLKAKVYKAPMVEILKNLKFPYHDVKIGFTQNVTFK